MSYRNKLLFILVTGGACLFLGCGRPGPMELFQEGALLMEQGNYVSARHRFEQILENHPDFKMNAAIKISIADCFNQEGRTDDARAIFEEIIEERHGTESSWRAYVRLGDMARIEEDWTTAETHFRAAIADTTDTRLQMRARANLAESFLQSGSSERALEVYRKILSLQDAQVEELKTQPSDAPSVRGGLRSSLLERLQTAQILANLHIREGQDEEAWTTVLTVDDASYTYTDRRGYYDTILQSAGATGKYQEGFDYFDSKVEATTDEEMASLALYFKGHLASATDIYLATGVEILKQVHERFPTSVMGRYAEADAAVVVLAASDQIAGAVEQASELFAAALDNYDDIINDMTMEWYYPLQVANAWKQVAKIYEIRGLNLQSVEDLRSASATHFEIVNRFKDTFAQEAARVSFGHVQRLAYMVHIAEASPVEFWEDFRRARAGLPTLAQELAQAETEAATETEKAGGIEP